MLAKLGKISVALALGLMLSLSLFASLTFARSITSTHAQQQLQSAPGHDDGGSKAKDGQDDIGGDDGGLFGWDDNGSWGQDGFGGFDDFAAKKHR